MPENKPLSLRRDLGIWSATSIVVGTIIGSGIFLVPTSMIQKVGSPEMVLIVFVVGGVLSLAGALSYAELASALPEAGGECRTHLYPGGRIGLVFGAPALVDHLDAYLDGPA